MHVRACGHAGSRTCDLALTGGDGVGGGGGGLLLRDPRFIPRLSRSGEAADTTAHAAMNVTRRREDIMALLQCQGSVVKGSVHTIT
jgi:hypothetical protein